MLGMCVCDVCVHVHMYAIRESTCVYAYQCTSGASSQLSSSVAPCLILGEQGFRWSSPIGQTSWQPLWVFVSPPPGTRTPGTCCLTRLFTRVLAVKVIAPSLLGKLTSAQPITPNPKKNLVAKIYFLLLRNMTTDFFFLIKQRIFGLLLCGRSSWLPPSLIFLEKILTHNKGCQDVWAFCHVTPQGMTYWMVLLGKVSTQGKCAWTAVDHQSTPHCVSI